MKNFSIILLGAISLVFASCEEKTMTGGKPIRIGDKSLIVTETDSSKLANYTRDISERAQDESDIARIMVQVDSVKVSDELAAFTEGDSTVDGFTIEFARCKVVFDGLQARELSEQNPEENRSVSYLVTKGDLAKMKLKITGLQDVSVKERIYTKLKVARNGEEYLLKSLGRKISDWFPLAGNDNVFVALGDNSAQFNNLDNAKLKTALKKELVSEDKDPETIDEWLRAVKNTNDYTDAPCKLYVATAQFRIRGKNSKGSVNKLIQFDIVE